MKVKLLSCTPNGDRLAGEAAAVCYQSNDPEKSLRLTLKSGHESVIEHVSFTFKIEGVSRALLAQLTRHRIASFSVMSQRYVSMENAQSVVPETIKNNESAYLLYLNAIAETQEAYNALVKMGIPKEDARFITPQGMCTEIVMTMNARELRHFFSLRCCNRAQWEIRAVADEMLRICKEKCPVIFENAGPECIRRGCTEGRPCGNPRKWEPLFQKAD